MPKTSERILLTIAFFSVHLSTFTPEILWTVKNSEGESEIARDANGLRPDFLSEITLLAVMHYKNSKSFLIVFVCQSYTVTTSQRFEYIYILYVSKYSSDITTVL